MNHAPRNPRRRRPTSSSYSWIVLGTIPVVILVVASCAAVAADATNGGAGGVWQDGRKLDFGDFSEDIPETCPVVTTCPVVCVASVSSCPTPPCASGRQLCATGDCAANCTANYNNNNPCPCNSLPVACPKTDDFLSVCQEEFQAHYYANEACLVEQNANDVKQVSFAGSWFLAMYYFYGSLALVVAIWCFGNQSTALLPLHHSTIPLQQATNNTAPPTTTTNAATGTATAAAWTQTGYKINLLGSVIDLLVEFSFVLVQVLLLATTLHYYMQQGAVNRWKAHFHDDVQALKSFAIVWMLGFLWCFAFRYPTTGVQSLFLQRCNVNHATHIAVVAPIQTVRRKTSSAQVPSKVGDVVAMIWAPIDFTMRVFFSYPYNQPGTETVFCNVELDDETGTRSILHRMRRYVFDKETNGYIPCVLIVGTTFDELLAQAGGLSRKEAIQRRGRQGPNAIPFAKPTILESLDKEFGKTLYLYQNFCVWVFANFWFYYMAIIYTFYRVLGAAVVVYFQHKNECLLYEQSRVLGVAKVLRDGEYERIHIQDVVPGDIMVLELGVVYCDMVVVEGFRVLVDESALTGEATPLLKTEIDPAMGDYVYSHLQHKGCTILAGADILELDENEITHGLVMATGSFTTKGELLTDVFSYRQHNSQFAAELRVILFVFAIEAIIMVALVFSFLNTNWVYAWFYGAYVLASILPPLLPTVFVVSLCVSAKRLQLKRISCKHPEAIALAGKVDVTFFDKTGTLTQSGLEFISCDGSSSDDRARIGMAVCHTLTTTRTGKVVGNQVDMASFKSTGAVLIHDSSEPAIVTLDGETYTVLKRFEFDCSRATQSVIVETGEGQRQIYVKGSPDVIKRICMESSMTDTFDKTVQDTAAAGVYQIAMAYRSYNLDMQLSDVRRDDVEGMLTFCGFVNFQNPMRDETPSVLQELAESEMASAMITGDNVHTGIFIAREAYMIKSNRIMVMGRLVSDKEIEWVDTDHNNAIVVTPTANALNLPGNDIDLAITGEAWRFLCRTDPNYAASIMCRIRVFGRCKPADKVSVVTTFVEHGYTTLMCGDGQNDCGCLKTAHVGVALSNAEASIVAPFTSLDKSLTSVLEVLREGRCALASCLSAYSYYIVHGQTETYLRVIMAFFSVMLSEWCWLFLDGIWAISLAFSIPLSPAAKRLASRPPSCSLIGRETIFSVCGILAWNFFYLVLALIILFQQDWFQCRKWESEDVSIPNIIGDNYESSVIFIVGGYQYIASAIVLNFGYSYRQIWYKNFAFVLFATMWTMFFCVFTLYPSSFSCLWRVNCDNDDVVRSVTNASPLPIQNLFNTTVMPQSFRLILVAIMALNLITITAWNTFFVNGYLKRRRERSGNDSRKRSGSIEQPIRA